MNFDSFNLDPKLLSNIKTLGYINPTPIQEKSIQPILQEKDIMGLAQTGTGKTAAFLLPILQQLLSTTPATKAVRALVIAPTRELAQQIDDSVKSLARGTGLRSVALYGGIKIGGQISALRQGVDIVVACPGRLLDHLQQRTVQLSQVKILVLDEADQMFDMGFLPNIRRILKQLPKKRQTLLFSATMPSAVDVLAQEILHQPVTISIARSSTPSSVQQTIFPVTAHQKSELLIHLLHRTEMESVLIFTRTKHTAKNLSLTLEQAGFRTSSLQGNLSQNKRQAVMNNFRSGKLKILVATDIASRGIDVMSISHVINYDMPGTVEAYIHRIGRTGRAAKSGDAYTFASDQDQHEIRRIEKILGFKLKQHRFEDFDYKAASTKPKRSSSNRRSEYKAHPRRQDRDQDARKGRRDRSEYPAHPRRQDRDQDQDARREQRGHACRL